MGFGGVNPTRNGDQVVIEGLDRLADLASLAANPYCGVGYFSSVAGIISSASEINPPTGGSLFAINDLLAFTPSNPSNNLGPLAVDSLIVDGFYGLELVDSGGTLSPPILPSATAVNGGSLPSVSVYYVITSVSLSGESTRSLQVSVTITPPNQSVQLSWQHIPGAIGYNVYRSTVSGVYGANSLAIELILDQDDFGRNPIVTLDTGSALALGSPPTTNTATVGAVLMVSPASFTQSGVIVFGAQILPEGMKAFEQVGLYNAGAIEAGLSLLQGHPPLVRTPGASVGVYNATATGIPESGGTLADLYCGRSNVQEDITINPFVVASGVTPTASDSWIIQNQLNVDGSGNHVQYLLFGNSFIGFLLELVTNFPTLGRNLVAIAGDLDVTGEIQSNGTPGISGSFSIGGRTVTVTNGLITGIV